MLTASLSFTKSRVQYSLSNLFEALGVARVSLPRWGWLAPTLIVLLAGVLRFYNLAHPNAIVFDETYYAKDAYSYLHYGYEVSWSSGVDHAFASGDFSGILPNSPEYVVHPPLGKWMIAWGMAIFGENAFGWRVSAAIIGTLAVALLAVAGWLMFRSVTVASIAALLGAVDGLMFVESRLALLDIFQMFWILATFVCLLLDRQTARRRLAANVMKIVDAHGESGLQKVVFGPGSGLHLWRLAAGICAGAAVAVKWNSLFFIAAMGVLTVFWDMNARRILGLKNWGLVALIREGIPAFIQMIGVGLIVYLTTWIGWFKSSNAFYRHWSNQFPDSGAVEWLPEDLRLLWEYHTSAFKFHSGLSSEHRYASQAWQWLILGHPTSYYYEAPKFGEKGCTALNCSQAILNIGNPLIWWVFIPAIILALVIFVLKRDWRFGALLLVFAAGYLPWFLYPNRTMFFFYALSFEPFLLILLAGCLGVLLGNRTSSVRRVRVGVLCVGIYLTAVLLVSAYFWPLWTGQVIPYEQWYGHMWIPTWI